jgi:hypothetical protein
MKRLLLLAGLLMLPVQMLLAQDAPQPGTQILQNSDFSDGTDHWHGDVKPAGSDSTTDFITNPSGAKGILVDLRSHNRTEVTQEVIYPKGIKGNMGVDVTVEYSTSPDFKFSESRFASASSSNGGSEIQEIPSSASSIAISIHVPPLEATHVENSINGPITVPNPDIISDATLAPDPTNGSHTFTKTIWLPPPQGTDPAVTPEPAHLILDLPAGTGSITFTKISMTISAGPVQPPPHLGPYKPWEIHVTPGTFHHSPPSDQSQQGQ